eukprot:1181887-Prorocentrum_minimum.AAC.3
MATHIRSKARVPCHGAAQVCRYMYTLLKEYVCHTRVTLLSHAGVPLHVHTSEGVLPLDPLLAQVCRYMYTLLKEYSARQTFAVERRAGAKEIVCEDDLYRHYNLHMYVHGDNTTCLRPPRGPFGPPGYGGAYDGQASPENR